MADHMQNTTIPPGFVLVPREPTEAMVHAAPGRAGQATEESMYHGIWRAMVAAAEVGK